MNYGSNELANGCPGKRKIAGFLYPLIAGTGRILKMEIKVTVRVGD